MPDTNPDAVKMLSDDEVAEIANRKSYQYGTMVSLTVAERDALCATVRALRADMTLIENYVAEIKRELGLPPNAHLSLSLENYKERITVPLRAENEQLRKQVADLEHDFDALVKESDSAEETMMRKLYGK